MRMHTRARLALAFALAQAAACDQGPPPSAQVVSASEIGLLPMNPEIQGRDGGYSVRAWGRSIFLFGDTVLTVPDDDGATWHHNSFSIAADLDASDGIDGFVEPHDDAGAPRYFIAPTAEERAFNLAHAGDPCQEQPCGARWAVWPGAAVYDAARDRVLAFYGLVYAEPGDFNFHGVGQGVAVWSALDAAPERPELSPGSEHPTLLFGENDPGFGVAALIAGDDLYVYGNRLDVATHRLVVARVALADLLDRSAWRFWDGSGWSAALSDAAYVMDAAPIADIGWNDYLGQYQAIYSRPFDRRVVMRTAPDPTGPWSQELLLFRADVPADASVYDAVAHRDYAEDGGRVQYVTYSRANDRAWLATDFPLVRVELSAE